MHCGGAGTNNTINVKARRDATLQHSRDGSTRRAQCVPMRLPPPPPPWQMQRHLVLRCGPRRDGGRRHRWLDVRKVSVARPACLQASVVVCTMSSRLHAHIASLSPCAPRSWRRRVAAARAQCTGQGISGESAKPWLPGYHTSDLLHCEGTGCTKSAPEKPRSDKRSGTYCSHGRHARNEARLDSLLVHTNVRTNRCMLPLCAFPCACAYAQKCRVSSASGYVKPLIAARCTRTVS